MCVSNSSSDMVMLYACFSCCLVFQCSTRHVLESKIHSSVIAVQGGLSGGVFLFAVKKENMKLLLGAANVASVDLKCKSGLMRWLRSPKGVVSSRYGRINFRHKNRFTVQACISSQKSTNSTKSCLLPFISVGLMGDVHIAVGGDSPILNCAGAN